MIHSILSGRFDLRAQDPTAGPDKIGPFIDGT